MTWFWVLLTDQHGMCTFGASPEWCTCSQVLSGFWSWLLLASWNCLGTAQTSCFFQATKDIFGGSPSPSSFPCSFPCPLASQTGGPCSSHYTLSSRMLCEVSGMERWSSQQVFEYMLWQILI